MYWGNENGTRTKISIFFFFLTCTFDIIYSFFIGISIHYNYNLYAFLFNFYYKYQYSRKIKKYGFLKCIETVTIYDFDELLFRTQTPYKIILCLHIITAYYIIFPISSLFVCISRLYSYGFIITSIRFSYTRYHNCWC